MSQEFATTSAAEPGQARTVGSLAALSEFRGALYAAIGARADAVFELSDAVLEHEGQVDSLPELSLQDAFTRGHGSVYGAVNAGRVDSVAVRSAALAEPLPRMRGHIVLAVDVSPWLRPDAACSPERLFIKQDLGWTVPAVRDPRAADTWTVIVTAVYLQLWLARELVADHRLPWERPYRLGSARPGTSAADYATSAAHSPATPVSRNPPGPGRPKGAKNHR